MAENDSLPGRVRRYARVSTAMGGLAARLAGERYLGLEIDRPRHAAALTRALGGIKGPLMKVAQLLATIPNALPQEYARELATLQADAPSMGWPFVKRRMASELGPNWEQRFKSFEHEAARAASLGQVHRAVAKDGRALACKLQYPDMGSAVEADLTQLKLFLSLYERYDRAISTDEILAEIGDRLREELDYSREAAHLRLYHLMLAGEPGVTIPEPVPELFDFAPPHHDLARGQTDARGCEGAAREPQRDRAQYVPRLVHPVLLLWRHPWRPASRQLHRAPGRRDQPP